MEYIMGFADWFAIKTPAQRKRESMLYDRWAFPHGQAQREKIQTLLVELMPKEDPISGMAVYLIGREGYLGSFRMLPEEQAERTEEKKMAAMRHALENQLRGKFRKDMPLYMALILADANIGPDLAYPTAEELKKKAQELA